MRLFRQVFHRILREFAESEVSRVFELQYQPPSPFGVAINFLYQFAPVRGSPRSPRSSQKLRPPTDHGFRLKAPSQPTPLHTRVKPLQFLCSYQPPLMGVFEANFPNFGVSWVSCVDFRVTLTDTVNPP